MGFVEKNLMPNESIIFTTKLSAIRQFLPPVTWSLFGLAMIFSGRDNPAGYILTAIGFVLLGRNFLAYSQSEFAVTNKRVIIKVGIIRRKSLDILLTKVESVGLNQSILDRLYGCGTIVINGSGNVSQAFPDVEGPVEFRGHVQSQIAEKEAA